MTGAVDTRPSFKRWLQVAQEAAYYANDQMTNRDLIPIPVERRTWTAWGYFSYWIVEGVAITGYTTVAAMVGMGLSVRQAIGCAVAAGVLYGLMAVVSGWVGAHHHIGFPVFSRATFGVRGFYFPIVVRIVTLIIWFGVQSYYGGQAVRVVIGAMSPSFASWNTFPKTKGNITSADFVGLVIYMIIIVPCLLIPPEKLQVFFRVSFVFVFMSMMGMLIYAMHESGGPGPLFSKTTVLSGSRLAWAVVEGMFSIIGVAGTGILGQSDWTRFATKKNDPVVAQLVGAPVALTFSGLIGALNTSVARRLFGRVVWNPLHFLSHIQARENHSARARVGVFFAGCGFVSQQLAINILLNSVSAGMDMTGLAPRYLNIRRSSYIVAALSIACCPWFLQSDARVVLIFGAGWGCFCASFTGIAAAKYFWIYKRKVLLSHLYIQESQSIYWFWEGVDWRSFAAWCVGTGFLMPGLAFAANEEVRTFWTHIFRISYAWGFFVSGLVTVLLHYIFPDKDIPVNYEWDELYKPNGDLVDVINSTMIETGDITPEKSSIQGTTNDNL